MVKQALVSVVLALFTCCSAVAVFAGTADADAKKAMDAKPKSVIRCSLDERDGTFIPSRAMAKLSKGDSIVFLPGCYGEIVINEDSVIVSTEGSKAVDVSVVLKGKNCIVRGFYGRRIDTKNNAIIVNSCFNTLSVSGSSEKKTDVSVYNSAMTGIFCSYCCDKGLNLSLANCVVRVRAMQIASPTRMLPEGACGAAASEESCVRVPSRMTLEMQNCVLESGGYVFCFSPYDKRGKPKITTKNNILLGKKGLGIIRGCSDGKINNLTLLGVKDMKKMVSVSVQGDENDVGSIGFLGNDPRSTSFFIVSKPNLEEKGIGIIKEQNPFFNISPEESDATSPEDTCRPGREEDIPLPRRPPERRVEPERKPPEEHPPEEDENDVFDVE